MKIRTVTKNFLLATIVCFTFGGIAKSYGQSDLISIKAAICDELDKEEKVYTDNGSYNRIFYYKFIDENLLQVRQFPGVIRSGERESSAEKSITIDMSKVTGIISNKTNFGYKCRALFGDEYVFNIQYKRGYDQDWTDIEYETKITLATDNKELMRLFQEWAKIATKN